MPSVAAQVDESLNQDVPGGEPHHRCDAEPVCQQVHRDLGRDRNGSEMVDIIPLRIEPWIERGGIKHNDPGLSGEI
jgi:hypothetical protein